MPIKKEVFYLAFPLDNQKAGIHVYTKEVLHALHELEQDEFNISIIRSQQSKEYPKFTSYVLPNFPFIPGYQTLRLFLIVPLLCILKKADIVIEPAHFGPFNLPKRIKRLTVIHDLTPILFPKWHTFNGWFLQRLFLGKILAKAHKIIAVSNHTKKDIIDIYKIKSDKIESIPLGVTDDYIPTSDYKILLKHKIENDFFLTVGTLEPRKNHIFILKAYERYKTIRPKSKIKLVIAGEVGWKSKSFFEHLNNSPNKNDVILTGYVSDYDKKVLYSSCKLFIYASHYEGFGLPVIEAAACGAICIIKNNSSLREFDKINVLFMDTQDDLIEIMTSYSDIKRNNYSAILKNHYSWGNYANHLIRILR